MIFDTDDKETFVTDYKFIPNMFGIYGNLLGFALVFRTGLAYRRYNEGVTSVELSSTKLLDSVNFV